MGNFSATCSCDNLTGPNGDRISEDIAVLNSTSLREAGIVPDDGLERLHKVPSVAAPVVSALSSNTTTANNLTSSLVYIEHSPMAMSAASSTDCGLSSRRSESSSRALTVTKAMSMMKTTGLGLVNVCPAQLDKQKVAAFRDRLAKAGIDTAKWGYGGAKSIEHLFWEVESQRGCVIITLPSGALKRITRLVKIALVTEIFGVDHALFSRMQFMHDGQTVERKQVPLRKLSWLDTDSGDLQANADDLSAELCVFTENWRTGCRKTLQDRLGLTTTWQNQHLVEDELAYKYIVEDNVKSDGYPGLNTMYCIHEVTFRIRDPSHAGVQLIGLPEGQEFATAEGDFNFHGQQDDHGLAIGTQLNIWTWSRVQASVDKDSSLSKPVAAAAAATAQPQVPPKPSAAVKTPEEQLLIRRVPLPPSAAQIMGGMQYRLHPTRRSTEPPSGVLFSCMDTLTTNWKKAHNIASRILDAGYTLQHFNDDLGCFPELNLYLFDEKRSLSRHSSVNAVSSGRTIGDEFQRTIGAFFAIYWMMRIDIDGRDGFSNGVDDDWKPVKLTDDDDPRVTQAGKRRKFQQDAKWCFFKKLLMNAGLIEEKKVTSWFKTTTKIVVNEKRLVSLLALTAIHDIMKMNMILPEVQKEHAPYHGYAAGDTISDHDHALSYVMDHFPQLLPSFRDLDAAERRSVHFTQCDLCFNHGWFVQAEAPPGAIFTKFREALIRDHKSQIGQRDVALYFVHWLTDLAGAEPSPLAGCEKFVTKFPLPVLNSFLRSFEFVEQIATRTETEVMEEYLKMRWTENDLDLGPLPTGSAAIAKMRLLCMAQGNASVILHDWDKLTDEDRETLAVEMSRTGCVGQTFSQDLCPRDTWERLEGPAFLVYYGPAFLQQMGTDLPVERLSVLAEIYRGARELWPTSISKVASNVTVRIDIIKALSIEEMYEAILRGDTWLLVKHNESEAFVERSSHRKLNKLIATSSSFQVLDLSCLKPYAMYR
mmetsp:Transcript_17510/g.37463  ORF Transcript_17510/g.37463 Transcript_17510/m.37463 type:complete len:986 (-) Transcript_17510:581-3538(-)